MLNPYKLEIFRAVSQAGSFSRAAERLLMTQSAVSQHVQDLEAALGAALFTRGARGVTLTEAGTTLLDYTHRILKLVSEAELAVTDVARLAGVSLSIGASPGVSAYLLPEWIDAFQDAYPNVALSLQTDTTPQLLAKLFSQQLRLVLIEGELDNVERADELDVMVLENTPQFVVVGRKHPWWPRDTLMLSELDGQALVTRQRSSQTRLWLDQLFAQHGVRPVIKAEFDNPESIKRAVATRMACAILPEYATRAEEHLGQLKRLTVTDAVLVRSLKLARLCDADVTPVECAFLKTMAGRYDAIRERLPLVRR